MAPPKRMPRLYLVRHGETQWSLSGQHTGRTDIPLTEHGEQVTRVLGPGLISTDGSKMIDPRTISHILVSPRKRSQRTLELLLQHLSQADRSQIVQPEIRQECREWDYGAYEGLLTHEIRAQHPGWDIWRDGTPDHPQRAAELPGESAQAMTDRIDGVICYIRGLQRAVIEGHPETTGDCEVVKRGGDVLLVAHGHFNRVFIARWLNLPITNGRLFEADPGSMTVLSYAHDSFDEPTIGGMFSSKTGPRPDVRAPSGSTSAASTPLVNGAAVAAGAGPSEPHPELQYLSLVQRVIETGEQRGDRTGTGTLALFAPTPALRFDLSQGTFPLLTTKRVFTRGVIEELLWFVGGKTDGKLLTERDIHIWDGNGSLEFLASRGLSHRREGDLGPVYGFQWRHFGAEYKDADADYEGQGVDQLKEVIRTIKENPTDRRIILSAWNPKDLPLMALPPCHMFCQFFVSLPSTDAPAGTKPGLSCQMYQRSCDLGLGVPFNIASYAALTHMIAHVTGTEAKELILAMGDAHVYKDHVEPLKIQLQRTPTAFPKLAFARQVPDIDSFKYEDFVVQGYKPQGKIEMKMSV